MSEFVKELDAKDFDSFIKSGKPVLIDFWAVWCGPCKALAPYVEQLAKEYDGKALFGKVNIDDCLSLAERYDVTSIPTLIVFKNGKLLERTVGMRPKAAIAELINKHI